MGLVRSSTPNSLLTIPTFVPSKTSAEQTGLSVNSAAFKRTNPSQPQQLIPPQSTSAVQPLTTGTTLNLNVTSFRPTNVKSPAANASVNQQIV